MAYTLPQLVKSPKSSVDPNSIRVIYDGGENSYSVVLLTWEGAEGCVGVRWNGAENGIGNPQSSGSPTWFILPRPIAELVKKNPYFLEPES